VSGLHAPEWHIDPIRFPRAAAFVAGLPHGLASYPECQQKASLVRALLEGAPIDVPAGLLPPAIAELLANPPPANVWLPVAVGRAAWLAVLDLRFPNDDETALAFADGTYGALARSSMYSQLLHHLPPSVIARGASLRWRALYRGIELELRHVSAEGASGFMRYPAHLTPRFNAISTARGLAISLRASKARTAEVRLVEWTPTYAVIDARYST
jgi:hypothetical protein